MQNNTEYSKEPLYAGFFVRLAAYILDWIIVTAVLLIVKIPFGISSLINPDNFVVRDFIFQYSIADIICYGLGVTYFVLLTYKTGATLGKKALHIQVISADEDRKPTFFEILYRETVGRFLSGLILQGGYLMIFVHKENRGLHDWMADTKVVYYHEKIVHVKTPITKREVPVFVPVTTVPKEPPAEVVETTIATASETSAQVTTPEEVL